MKHSLLTLVRWAPIALTSLALGSTAGADVLASWDFSTQVAPTANVPPTPPVMASSLATTAAGVTCSDMTTESRISTYAGLMYDMGNAAPAELNLKWWDGDSTDNPGSFNNAINDNYLSFTLTATGGPIDLTRLSIHEWRNGGGAPQTMAWTIIVDGGAETPFGSPVLDPNTGDFGFDWFNADGSVTANSTLEIRFRPYGCCGNNGTGNLHIDGLTVEGTVGAGAGSEYCAEAAYTCPCFVVSAIGEGCPNTTGVGATILGAGDPSIAASTFSLTAAQLPNTSGLFVQGTSALGGADGNPVGEGRLCLNPQKRYSPQSTSSGTVTRSNFQNFASAGQSMNYQYWYRDPSNTCNGGGFNFSPAWNVTWGL